MCQIEGASPVQPSSDQPTDSGLGSGEAIPKLSSISGEGILLLIWTFASGHCDAKTCFFSSRVGANIY